MYLLRMASRERKRCTYTCARTQHGEPTGLQVLAVGVVDHGQAEEQAVGQAVVLHDAHVLLLGHESRQGAEASVADQLRVAQLAGGEVDLEVAAGHGRLKSVKGSGYFKIVGVWDDGVCRRNTAAARPRCA